MGSDRVKEDLVQLEFNTWSTLRMTYHYIGTHTHTHVHAPNRDYLECIPVALVYKSQVLRFSFPGKKIVGLAYKCYRNEFLMS